MSEPLTIRCSDRAIFEASYPPIMDKLLLTRIDGREFMAALEKYAGASPYYFERLIWLPWFPWHWCFGGRLVRSGEVWEPKQDYEFEVVARHLVIAGCKQLAKRKP